MLNTPAGMPVWRAARRMTSATHSAVAIWPVWALNTTGQPAASAAAVSPPAVENASGKLLAPNTATGPTLPRLAQIGARQRLPIRQRRIDTGSQTVAAPQYAGKQPHLAAGAPAFTAQPGHGQRRLPAGKGQKLVVQRIQLIGNGIQKPGPMFRRQAAINAKGATGRLAGGDSLLFGGLIKTPRQRFAADGVKLSSTVSPWALRSLPIKLYPVIFMT